eukprot:gene10066-11910_t
MSSPDALHDVHNIPDTPTTLGETPTAFTDDPYRTSEDIDNEIGSDGLFVPDPVTVERFKQSAWSGLSVFRRQSATMWIPAGKNKRKISVGSKVMLSDEPKSFSRSLKATQVITVSCKDIVQVSSPTSLPGSLQEWGEANLELLACVETAKKKVLLMFPSVEKKSEWMSALEALRLGKRLRVKEHNGDVSKESLNSTSTETEEPEKTDDGRTLATPPHTPVTTGLATSPPGPKPAEPMRVEKELAVVIVGKTGNGKSATANSLLGERLFESSLGGSSVTAKCQSHEVQYEEKNITVIDTPGMFDTTRNEEEVEKEIEQCIELASAGISAILVVINPMTRFTQEEASSIMGLEKVFGKRLMDHMGIVFTHGDGVTIDDLKHYLDTAPKNLQDLLVRMGFGERSRAVLVDNSSSFPSKVGLQQKLLVNLVGNILERNEGKVYERSDLETAHEEAKQARAAEEKAKADEREKQESELRKAIEGQYQLRLELAKNEIRDDIRRELDEKDAEQREHLKNELTTKLAAAKESIQIEAKGEIDQALKDLRNLHLEDDDDREHMCSIQ